MPIWLILLVLGGGGYFAYKQFIEKKYPEGLESPASQAIFDLVRETAEKWRAGEIAGDALETQIDVISDRQLDLREAGQMTMSEYNVLNEHKVAVLGAAGVL